MAHRIWHQLVVLAPAGEVVTAKLTSLVGMDHHRSRWTPAPHSHRERIQHQLCSHAGVHCPADHHARVQVNYSRQVQPAFMGSDIGNVDDPHLVRQRDRELWIGLPSVIATALYAQNAAHAAEPELAFVLGHECVLHPDSLAKYVAAFFRMSRSSLALLSSALSRDT